jgi:hypothetical protein
MQRIHDPTAAPALPATPALTGPTGYFTWGVPGVTAPTIVRDWWLNMIQEELLALLTAAGITPDTTGANNTQVLQAIRALGKNFMPFGTPGLFNFTVPAGITTLEVELWAGGGAGGAAVLANQAGSGGGGGTWAHKIITGVTPGAVIPVTVGAGGVGNSTGTGGNGGASSFGSYLSAAGSTGGAGDQGPPGSGQNATGADLAIAGGVGVDGFLVTATFSIGGAGGSSPRGGQGATMGVGSPGNNGNVGQIPGGGGGGGNTTTATTASGGNGAQGLVVVRW